MDLLGSDLPVESSEGMKFAWSDGILLQVEVSYIGVLYFLFLLEIAVSLFLLVLCICRLLSREVGFCWMNLILLHSLSWRYLMDYLTFSL